MTNVRIALLLTLPLLACSAREDGFDMGRGCGPDSTCLAAFDAASAEWCDRAGLCAYHATGPGGVRRVESLGILGGPGAGAVQMPRKHGGSTILILDSIPDANLRVVMLHELGHHFGCPERNDHPNSIMAQSPVRTAIHLTDDDLACAD